MQPMERVKAALRRAEVDRPPYSFWTHLPGIDLDPERLAAETAAFSARYDLDVVKSMPNGFYCVEDWGCVCDYGDIARGGTARVTHPAVAAPGDWSRIEPLAATRGSFGRELSHLERLVARLGGARPVLATVFSPLTVAAKLSNGAVRRHLAEDPQPVMRALEAITATTCAFAREAIGRGCAGVFFAIQEATRSAFDEASYRRYGEPYDRRVLEAARHAGGWLNTVHLHGEDILFDLVCAYEADALNWHVGETAPAISDYLGGGGRRPIMGGLQRAHLTRGDMAAVRADIRSAMAESGGRGLVLAPACVIRHPVDDAVLRAVAAQIKALDPTSSTEESRTDRSF